MSKPTKWVLAIVVVVVVVLLLWWSGVFSGGQSATSQPAAAVIPATQNGPATSASTMTADSNAITQVSAALQQNQGFLTSAGTSPATTTIVALVASAKPIVASMMMLQTSFQTQIPGAKLSTSVTQALTAKLQDMMRQVQNAGSQITAASNNLTPPKPVKGKPSTYSSLMMQQQSAQELAAAQSDLNAALADAQSIEQGL